MYSQAGPSRRDLVKLNTIDFLPQDAPSQVVLVPAQQHRGGQSYAYAQSTIGDSSNSRLQALVQPHSLLPLPVHISRSLSQRSSQIGQYFPYQSGCGDSHTPFAAGSVAPPMSRSSTRISNTSGTSQDAPQSAVGGLEFVGDSYSPTFPVEGLLQGSSFGWATSECSTDQVPPMYLLRDDCTRTEVTGGGNNIVFDPKAECTELKNEERFLTHHPHIEDATSTLYKYSPLSFLDSPGIAEAMRLQPNVDQMAITPTNSFI
ncbi:hypothetical protein T440DRAFT_483407 [Plenodomus tracheiphilus IPT5]|uniref:Uncharacterized protein n=1 Tax=Plenodomus tracheiphilus IPT5 TaxID=1408161 RepID=A0A6A7AQ42_9PLEO|nr:hypothetical protein T440DRAFT_483407 [Plenodomus tracheiphilus IPT5]